MARKSHKKKKPHGKRLDKKIRNRAAGKIAKRKRERKRVERMKELGPFIVDFL